MYAYLGTSVRASKRCSDCSGNAWTIIGVDRRSGEVICKCNYCGKVENV